ALRRAAASARGRGGQRGEETSQPNWPRALLPPLSLSRARAPLSCPGLERADDPLPFTLPSSPPRRVVASRRPPPVISISIPPLPLHYITLLTLSHSHHPCVVASISLSICSIRDTSRL